MAFAVKMGLGLKLGLRSGGGSAPAPIPEPLENPNLITNSDFADTSDWYETRGVSALSASSGDLLCTADSAATFGQATTVTGLTIGESYTLTGTITTANPSITLRIRAHENDPLLGSLNYFTLDGSSSLSFSEEFVAVGSTVYIGTVNTGHSGADVVIVEGGISLKLVGVEPLTAPIALGEPEVPTTIPDLELHADLEMYDALEIYTNE